MNKRKFSEYNEEIWGRTQCLSICLVPSEVRAFDRFVTQRQENEDYDGSINGDGVSSLVSVIRL